MVPIGFIKLVLRESLRVCQNALMDLDEKETEKALDNTKKHNCVIKRVILTFNYFSIFKPYKESR